MQDGLLDESIEHVWNTELPLTAIRFGDGLPPHRFGAVSAIEQLLLDCGPTWAEPIGKLGQRDPVGARGPAVGADLVPGSLHVVPLDDSFHQGLWKYTQGLRFSPTPTR